MLIGGWTDDHFRMIICARRRRAIFVEGVKALWHESQSLVGTYERTGAVTRTFLAPLARLERATRCLEVAPKGRTARH